VAHVDGHGLIATRALAPDLGRGQPGGGDGRLRRRADANEREAGSFL
jgi:hypothetical protein